MSRFKLSEWALRNRGLVVYAMVLLSIAGIVSYTRLGQSEDPPFTFKAMVIRTLWPGATAEEVARSEEHTSELQSLMRISYSVFCLKKKNENVNNVLQTTTREINNIK